MNKGKKKPRNNIKDKQVSIKKDPVQLSELFLTNVIAK